MKKKNSTSLFAGMVVLMMALVLTGCSGKKDPFKGAVYTGERNGEEVTLTFHKSDPSFTLTGEGENSTGTYERITAIEATMDGIAVILPLKGNTLEFPDVPDMDGELSQLTRLTRKSGQGPVKNTVWESTLEAKGVTMTMTIEFFSDAFTAKVAGAKEGEPIQTQTVGSGSYQVFDGVELTIGSKKEYLALDGTTLRDAEKKVSLTQGGAKPAAAPAKAASGGGEAAPAAAPAPAKTSAKAAKAPAAAPATDFTYDLTEDGNGVLIKGYDGEGGAVVIPGEIDGFPVTEIGWGAFAVGNDTETKGTDTNYKRSKVTSIVVPDSVKKIEPWAFAWNRDSGVWDKSLTSITLPKGLAYIPVAMCKGQTNLTELNNLSDSTIIAGVINVASAYGWNEEAAEKFEKAVPNNFGYYGTYYLGVHYQVPSDTKYVDDFYRKEQPVEFNTFEGCSKLPLPIRKKLQDMGYGGKF